MGATNRESPPNTSKMCWNCGMESTVLELVTCPLDGTEMELRANLNPDQVLVLQNKFKKVRTTITQRMILDQVNPILAKMCLPEIEQIRIIESLDGPGVRLSLWVRDIANEFHVVFYRSAASRDLTLPNGMSSWMKKSIEGSLEILCEFWCDFWYQSELTGWNEIPKKQEVQDE